jgi:prolyl-tRNA editing enzyme YbaK/EbsC (Cys-tRNA(Pro) deacylase)
MDPALERHATVWAAAGLPTAVFPISPATLRMLADAHVAAIAESPTIERAS